MSVESQVLEIIQDLSGDKPKWTDKLRDLIATPLWEGFVEDIRIELNVPNLKISPSWTVRQLVNKVMEEQKKIAEEPELPERTIILHIGDEVKDSIFDELEAILEKHRVPYGIVDVAFKNGKPVQTLLREADMGIEKVHDNVMELFRQE